MLILPKYLCFVYPNIMFLAFVHLFSSILTVNPRVFLMMLVLEVVEELKMVSAFALSESIIFKVLICFLL